MTKQIQMSYRDILELVKGNPVTLRVVEVYYDLDASEYMSTGKEEYAEVVVDD